MRAATAATTASSRDLVDPRHGRCTQWGVGRPQTAPSPFFPSEALLREQIDRRRQPAPARQPHVAFRQLILDEYEGGPSLIDWVCACYVSCKACILLLCKYIECMLHEARSEVNPMETIVTACSATVHCRLPSPVRRQPAPSPPPLQVLQHLLQVWRLLRQRVGAQGEAPAPPPHSPPPFWRSRR